MPIDFSMKTKMYLSLKYKLVAVLTVLPLVSLASFLFMATQLFETDKVAYVFDSSVAVSRFLSNQVRAEADLFLNISRPVVEGLVSVVPQKGEIGKESDTSGNMELGTLGTLLDSQNRVLAVGFLQVNGRGSNDSNVGKQFKIVRNSLLRSEDFERFRQSFNQNKTEIRERDLSLYSLDDEGLFLISKKVETSQKSGVIFGLYRSRSLQEAFDDSKIYNSFLIDKNLTPLISPQSGKKNGLLGLPLSKVFAPISSSEAPEGTAEVTINDQRVLVSFARLGEGGLILASVVDRKEALKAVNMMIAKSTLFFIALISATVIISFFASSRLTSSLRELFQATQKIAQGDFNVNVKTDSRDEVGGLAESFNWMAKEVSRLLNETAEKARMESELSTVKTVQETLFPEAEGEHGPFTIAGLFEPASECGGDWWNYSLVGDRLFLWIGDATGHGAPAALITSAARSAAAIVESFDDMSPARALEIMNRAIFATAKGKIMMTFFLGIIDIRTGKLVYSNASHDPPYLVSVSGKTKVSKKDLLPLMDNVGRRLGDQPESTYQDVELQLAPEDLLVLYTDGIIDLNNPDGEIWGERTFLKKLTGVISSEKDARGRLNLLKNEINQFRNGSILADDITLFLVQYGKAS